MASLSIDGGDKDKPKTKESLCGMVAKKTSWWAIPIMSLVLAIFPSVYIYGEPHFEKVNTEYVAINDLAARNIAFLCAILFGLNTLISLILTFASSVGISRDYLDATKLYESAMLAYKSDFLRTSASLLIVSLSFIYHQAPQNSDDHEDREVYGWAVMLSIIVSFVYKLYAEAGHRLYIEEEKLLDTPREAAKNDGSHVILSITAFVLLIVNSTITTNGLKPDVEGDPTQLFWILLTYILVSGLETLSDSGRKIPVLSKVMESFFDGIFGVRASRILACFALVMSGVFLAKHPTQDSLVIVLLIVALEGLQTGVVDFKAVLSDDGLDLRNLQGIVSFLTGILAIVVLYVDQKTPHLTVEDISPFNKTLDAYKQDRVLEPTFMLMRAVLTVAGILKLVEGVLYLIKLAKRSGDNESALKQKFEKFSTLGLLVTSSFLWAGGVTFWGMLADDVEDAEINTLAATLFFIVVLILRVIDCLTTSDLPFAIWPPNLNENEKGEKALKKVSNDNIRTWLVFGSLVTSLGFLLRYWENPPDPMCSDSEAEGYKDITCVNGIWATILISIHVLVAIPALLPIGKCDAPRNLALSAISVVRTLVSTAVICLLVVLIGQTDAVSQQKNITAPDSGVNNLFGALIAYLFADAFGDGFL